MADEAMVAAAKPTEIAVAVHSADLTIVALDMPDLASEVAFGEQDSVTTDPWWPVQGNLAY